MYSKENCVQCESTKKLLDNINVSYNTVDIETTPGALEELKAAGFRSAPVVITSNGAWSGHNEQKIRALV